MENGCQLSMASRWRLVGVPGAAGVVAEGHEEHDSEPKNTGDDDELGTLRAVVRVHEEQHHKSGFARGDDEGHDYVQAGEILIEVHRSRVDGSARENHQDKKDEKIDFR